MEQQPTFAGIGSACYLINKKDLQPDSLTPKEGKEWTKVDLKEMKPVDIVVEPGAEFTPPIEVPIPSFRSFRTSEDLHAIAKRTGFVMTGEVEDMLQGERERSEAFCKKLWDEIQNAPFDVILTDSDGNSRFIGHVDPSNIKVSVFDPYVRHFRKSRLRIKFRKKLMHYLVRYASHEPFDRIARDIYLYSKAAPTTRSMSKALNKIIKLAKRGNYEQPQNSRYRSTHPVT